MSDDAGSPPSRTRLRLSEDWAATLLGLVLLLAALVGLIPPGVIP